MKTCESCNRELNDFYFINSENICDYCFSIQGLGYVQENITIYPDFEEKTQEQNKSGWLW